MRFSQFITLSILCRVFALIVALASGACAHTTRFNTTDKVLQGSVAATLALDYVQTRKITLDGRESNPIIGKCGSSVRAEAHTCSGYVSPELYFLGVFALHTSVMYALPRPWRNAAQGLTLGVQSKAIIRNYQAGYNFSF